MSYKPPFEENIRTEARWQALWKHYDFREASVLDLGCHTGEMCLRALYWGAREVIGVDRDSQAITKARDYRLPGIIYHNLDFFSTDPHTDIVLLLSVIGYMLEDYGRESVASWLKHLGKNCEVVFIEPHFEGDGPGGFVDEHDFKKFLQLKCNFIDVRAITTLPVVGRSAQRTIFRCSHTESPLHFKEPVGRLVYRAWGGRITQLTDQQRPYEHLKREFTMLRSLSPDWFPKALELGPNYLITEDLGDGEAIFDPETFRQNAVIILENLEKVGIRHGDLTSRNIIVRNNVPVPIDFKESRFIWEDRPDKRPEPDEYHYLRAVEGLIDAHQRKT